MAETNFRYTNEKCPVCNEDFKSDDDIVVCHLCGTPHHRECYNQNTKCANNDKHGEFRWEPTYMEPEKIENEEFTITPLWAENIDPDKLPEGMPFPIMQINPLQNFPPQIEEDIKTVEAAYFVQQDITKYLTRFFKIKDKKRTWNWAAFFLAPYWFFYRKMYKLGAVFMAIFICISAISLLPPAVKFSNAVYAQEEKMKELSSSISTDEEYEEALIQLTNETNEIINENKTGVYLVFAQSFSALVTSVFIGLNANKWYYKHTIKQIRKEKAENTTPDGKPRPFENGGVSYGHAALSLLAEKGILFLLEMILSAFLL